MDMFEGVHEGVRDEFSDAEATFDRFHVVKLLNEVAEATVAPDMIEAYKLKVEFQELWDLPPIAAERCLERWHKAASESELAAIATSAETVRKHGKGILRWFHPVSGTVSSMPWTLSSKPPRPVLDDTAQPRT